MLSEIKEICEKKRKENDVLLAIAAGNRRPIVPNMDFDYVDRDIHDDLFQIIKYSCQEVCSSTDQLDKVVRIWTTFLEPMLGVSPRPQRIEELEDVTKCKVRAKTNVIITVESNGNPATNVAIANAKSSDGDIGIPREHVNSSKARLANGDAIILENGFHDSDRQVHRSDSLTGTLFHGRLQINAPMTGETALIEQPAPTECLMHNIAASTTVGLSGNFLWRY